MCFASCCVNFESSYLSAAVSHCGNAAVVQAAKAQAIEDLLQQLEEQTPALNVTEALDQLNGDWELLYTSLTIQVGYRLSTVKTNSIIQACELYTAHLVT